MRLFLIQMSLHLMVSCSPQMTKISGRNPDLFEKEKDPNSHGDGPISKPSPELYVKESKVTIQPAYSESSSGSLASPDDDRLHLFTDRRPTKVGRYINVLVASSKSPDDKNKQDNGPNPDDKDKSDKGTKKEDPLEEELLKDLPDLKPAQKDSVKLLKQIKMQVIHRFPNGDLMARIARSSTNPDSQEDFIAEAKIPAERLASGDPITTEDLVDVRVNENHGGEQVERRSTSWEDEYSLRLSGFNEAKSKAGLDLEEKRKELTEARERLEQRIKAFSAEKRQFVTQRDQVKKENSALNETAKSQGLTQNPAVSGPAKGTGQGDQAADANSNTPDKNTTNTEKKAAPTPSSKGEGNA